ncbi:hypothetical protein CIK05_04395 [Bdellovibrio sp. qaytius]|nr:hypothetical protein CIK05_04395 [Bdellovibrio sp. qaytius]
MERLTNCRFLILFFALYFSIAASASPTGTTYQARIVKPDRTGLEAPSVNFKFTVLDHAGSCILYSETYSAINMANSSGIISFTLGTGVKTYPASSTTFAQIFNNASAPLSCQGLGTTYTPQSTDSRKVVMQFNDTSGWQTLPAMAINAVPYSIYAGDSLRLGGVSATSYVRYSTIPTCTASQAMSYDGASFSCVTLASGGASGTITSSDVTTALGYTPANTSSVATSYTALTNSLSTVGTSFSTVTSTLNSLGSSVTAVTTSVASLSASMAAMISSQWATSGTTINYVAGRVGLGTTNPAATLDVSGGVRIGVVNSSCASALAGTLRYNAGLVEYCDGSSWSAFGVSGAGILALNGLTSGSQTIAFGSNGTSPNVSSTGTVHTFNFPFAASSAVTGGLLSNADYVAFVNQGTSITTLSSNISAVSATVAAVSASVSSLANSTAVSFAAMTASIISSINGSASSTQTFANNLTGSQPTYVTANGVHTLNIPYASAAATVTAGLISNADYLSFTGKITSSAVSIAQALGYIPANAVSVTTLSSTLATVSSAVTTAQTDIAAVSSTVNSISSTVVTKITSSAASIAAVLGYVPAASGGVSSQWNTSGTTINYTNGNVGVGTTNPTYKLAVSGSANINGAVVLGNTPPVAGTFDFGPLLGTSLYKATLLLQDTITDFSNDNTAGQISSVKFNASAANTSLAAGSIRYTQNVASSPADYNGGIYGSYEIVENNGSGTVGALAAVSPLVMQNGPGMTMNAYGVNSRVYNYQGTIVNSFGGVFASGNIGGTINNNYGIMIDLAGGAVDNNYGLFITDQSGKVASQTYNMYSAGSTSKNIFMGSIGLGVSNTTAKLHIAAGTNSTAPIKFTSGTLLTSPQSGTIEYDGFYYYITDGTNTRRSIATVASPGTFDNASTITSTGNISLVPTGSVIVSSTTASTSSTTGALVVKGGVGITGNLYSSGTIITSSNIQGSTFNATSDIYVGNRLGIGTTSPSYPLDIQSSSSFQQRILHASNNANDDAAIMLVRQRGTVSAASAVLNNDSIGGLYFRAHDGTDANTTNAHIEVSAAQNQTPGAKGNVMTFATTQASQTARQEIMRIHSNGFVGIGSTAPTALLTVGPSGAYATNYNIYAASYNNAAGQGQYVGNWAGNDWWGLGPATSAADNTLRLGRVSDRTGTWAVTQNTNLVLGGSFTIGATSGTEKLNVTGNLKFGSEYNQIMFPDPGGANAGMYGGISGDDLGYKRLNLYHKHSIAFATDTATPSYLNTRMYINASGAVGVGTVTPQTLLDVSGAIRISDDQSTCTSANNGSMRYVSSTALFQTCNGTDWGTLTTGDAIPASSTLLMGSCPAGWTDLGSAQASGPAAVFCNTGVACRMCRTAVATLLPAATEILLESCPTGWSNMGKIPSGVGQAAYMAGSTQVNFTSCQTPNVSGSTLPQGARYLAPACPASHNLVTVALGSTPSAASCAGVACNVCEVPGGDATYRRVFMGGTVTSATAAGADMSFVGGSGGSTSGDGGGITITGGSSSSGTAGGVTITGGSASGTGGTVYLQPGRNTTTSYYSPIAMAYSGGYVGIGTLFPQTKFEIKGTTNLSGATITNSSVLASGGLRITNDNNPTAEGITFGGATAPGAALVFRRLNQESAIDFYTNDGVSATSGAMTRVVSINKSGYLGVGVSEPVNPIHAFASGTTAIGVATLEVSGTNGRPVMFFKAENTLQGYVGNGITGLSNLILMNYVSGPTQIGTNSIIRMTVTSAGAVGIGTQSPAAALDVVGDIRGTGTVATWSDQRAKKNIEVIPESLNKILKLRGVNFDWRTEEFPDKKFKTTRDMGVIAQEVEKVFPEAVKTSPDSYKSVAYSLLVAPLIEAVKELYYKITGIERKVDRAVASIEEKKADKSEVDALKAENAELKSRLDRLEKMMLESQKAK